MCVCSYSILIIISIFVLPAISLLAFTSVEGYHGYLLFVWLYGVFLGGFHLTLSAFTLEKVHMRHFPRAWGFVQGAKAIPLLIGIPIVGYINQALDMPKGGYLFSFSCVFIGATCLFLVGCVSSKSNKNHHPYCKDGLGAVSLRGDSSLAAHDQLIMHEAVSDGILVGRGASAMTNLYGQPPLALGGCTCEHAWPAPPASIPELEHAIRRLSFGHGSGIYEKYVSDLDSKALVGVGEPRKSSFNSIVPLLEGTAFPEEEEEDEADVDEDDYDEEEVEVVAGQHALLAELVKPELLTCISEENLFENLDVEYFGECVSPSHAGVDMEDYLLGLSLGAPQESPVKVLTGLHGSISEPDLREASYPGPSHVSPSPPMDPSVHECGPVVNSSETPNSMSPNSAILSRQKTWHFFNKPRLAGIERKNDVVKGVPKPNRSTLGGSRPQQGSQMKRVLKTSLTPTVISEVTSFV